MQHAVRRKAYNFTTIDIIGPEQTLKYGYYNEEPSETVEDVTDCVNEHHGFQLVRL
jgi:hypothetical protein